MASSSPSSVSGVPPGFRFHPTDEELLLYYLKKKISYEKFDLEVIRDVDLNKMEPWDLQEKHNLQEDGWVVCRVFKKKCFFKVGSQGSGSHGQDQSHMSAEVSHELSRGLTLGEASYQGLQSNHYAANLYKSEAALQYWQMPTNPYFHGQAQDLLQNHRPPGGAYDFSGLPSVDACEGIQQVEERDQTANQWAVLDAVDGRFGNSSGAAVQQMDLWGYGK
ncbi:hypothetical protein J5N97_020885 [Dioscorea zingiberensis]|uniref:NAC domain-containing protein n=1 Tax=Dioscorea zingiberensis TaxID=325984 RepID=A0A9D5CGN2_9LILI|nr:hypothetical protein J5N97_020885 [Dioscorea zingiberensis]